MEIQLKLVNRSDDAGGADVVIFQKNLADPVDAPAVAWLVVSGFAPGQTYAFTYPTAVTVAASDSRGEPIPAVSAEAGQLFAVHASPDGDVLRCTDAAADERAIELRNGLAQAATDALVYRGGNVVAMKSAIPPEQTARFLFQPALWIGVAPMVRMGQVLDDLIMNDINTQLSLLDIRSADIIMSGGGGGGSPATPYRFEFDNVVFG
jgi:hypothetical protein